MKQIKLILVALCVLLVSGASAQSKAAPWPEMTAFHTLMAATFHPSEEGNFKPLKEKAAELYKAALAWHEAKIPENYKPKETNLTLELLVKQTAEINERVKADASDKELGAMIAAAHETFHKVAGECKKTEEAAH